MKLGFVDSDILLDVILKRSPFYDSSAQILSLPAHFDYKFCTTVHSLLNVHYLTRKHLGAQVARQAIVLLVEQLQIITEDTDIVNQAIQSGIADFEDAVQYFAAKSVNADFIITRNIKDYKQAAIPVLTAEQFLRTIL